MIRSILVFLIGIEQMKGRNERGLYSKSITIMANDTLNLYFNPLFKDGKWRIEKLPMIASVVMAAGSAIYAVGDGTHTKCTNGTANFRGILMEACLAADADHATSLKLRNVAVPVSPEAEAEFKRGAGTFTTADVGDTVLFTDETSVAVDAAGTQVMITKYISADRGVCRFNLAIS